MLNRTIIALLCFAGPIIGSPLQYAINFEATSGVAPTAASFMYDPDGGIYGVPSWDYGSLKVTWNAFRFELGIPPSDGAPDLNQLVFGPDPINALLAGGTWRGNYPVVALPATFNLFAGPEARNIGAYGCPLDGCYGNWFNTQASVASGTFTVFQSAIGSAAPASTPEPATILMAGLSVLALAILSRPRRPCR